MALSSVSYVGDGVTNLYSVTFPYLSKSNVKVFVEGVEDLSFTWVTSSSISLSSLAAVDALILIQRITPTAPLIDFSDGSNLTEELLDISTRQALYVVEESKDSLTGVLQLDLLTDTYDAKSKIISNVADPVSPQDVATKEWSETALSAGVAQAQASANIATTQAGIATTGANTATTQAGIATTGANTATTQAGIATTKAGEATTGANAATTQAGIATTGANTATTQAVIATAKASEALASANNATATANILDDNLGLIAKRASINPTIDSDFANQEYKLYEVPSGLSTKALTDIWTVMRSSTATIQDACGLARTVAANVPRITYDILGRASLLVEEARTNLFLHPRNFNLSSWSKTGVNVTGYKWFENGTLGYRITEDTSAATHNISQTPSFVTGNKYTFKWIVTNVVGRTFRVQTSSAFPSAQVARFDCNALTATVILGTGSASIKSIGSDLFELVFTTDASTVTTTGTALLGTELASSGSYTGDGTTSYYAIVGQLELGASATSIIPDATIFVSRASAGWRVNASGVWESVAADVERLSYNPANLNAEPVKLHEEASTNQFPYSDDFNNASWTKADTTSSAPAVYGATTATRILETATTTSHQVRYNGGIAPVVGKRYAFTVWVKVGLGRNKFRLALDPNVFPTPQEVSFDASTGEVTAINGTTGSITEVGDGVYKCSMLTIPATTVAALARRIQILNDAGDVSYTGDITKGIYLVRAQFEENNESSYIPTVATAVTRAADVTTGVQATRAGDLVSRTLGNEFNRSEGTLYVEFKASVLASSGTGVVSLSDGTLGNRIHIWLRPSTGEITGFIAKNTVVQADLRASAYTPNTLIKATLSFKQNLCIFTVNGISYTDTSAEIPPVTNLRLGDLVSAGTTYKFNGDYKKVHYYPKAITEVEAILLTS